MDAATLQQLTTVLSAAGLGLDILDRFNASPVAGAINLQTRVSAAQAEAFAAQGNALLATLGSMRDAHIETAQLQTMVTQTTNEALLLHANILQGLRIDLQSFSNPALFGQILQIGALLTGNDAVIHIKRLADQAEKMANSLDRIANNVYSENSRGDKFPGHIHSYIRHEIEKYHGTDVPHYFFVFNQSTSWYPEFDNIQRTKPLGPRFLGYKHDLDELVAFIVEHVRQEVGDQAVVHILVPVISEIAITESLTFPEAMKPFRIEGQLGESGLPFVYMCTPPEDRQYLYNVGFLRPRPRSICLRDFGILGLFGLLENPEPYFYEDPSFFERTRVGSPFYNREVMEWEPVPPRTLGMQRGGRD